MMIFGDELDPQMEAALAELSVATSTDTANHYFEMAFRAARDGLAVTLNAVLAELSAPERQSLLCRSYEDTDGQCCPPLVIAARNGHEKIVQMLVKKFDADVNVVGHVKVRGYAIDGASPLWCVACMGFASIVRFLVDAGADVDLSTKTLSTPLRASCFDGRLDIVQYLVDVGKADPDMANKFDNTCLMIASFRGHVDIVRFLLKMGVDPDKSARCGATALHFSAEAGALDVVKALVEVGRADTSAKNRFGSTPLMSAAEHCRADVFDYLYEQTASSMSRSERVDAVELIGASFANDKENYDLAKSFNYLMFGMTMRYVSGEPLEKGESVAVVAYDNHIECATLAELDSARESPLKMHMEGLAIRERIMHPANPELAQQIVFRGAVFADSMDFERCLALWKRALGIKQQPGVNASVAKDLLTFAQVFCQMMQLNVRIRFEDLREILAATAAAIKSNVEAIGSSAVILDDDDKEAIRDDLDANMRTFLYLLVIVGKSNVQTELLDAMRIVHDVCSKVRPCSPRSGRTLLHLAVDVGTPVDDFHTSDVVRFPCARTARLLLEAGADAEATDADGNTALHVIVGYERVVDDFMTLYTVVTSLVEAGAHVDVVNKDGQTAMARASTGVAEIILKSQQKLSLKCLSARAVVRHGLTFIGQVPAALECFIRMHGP